jgi:phosphotriesterase-related protein
MALVNGVLGPIDSADLGLTLMHEHVFSASAGIWQSWPELLGGREHFVAYAADILERARTEAGVRTFVDVTPIDLGRDIPIMREVAERSGVQIIPCTGHWLDVSRTIAARSIDELAALFTREIEAGIDGTQVRAGIIKVANDIEGVTEAGEKLLRAAARTHLRTGVPISTHTHATSEIGSRQADIFESEGVDLRRVYIGHSNDSTKIAYLSGLLDRGCWLGLDRYPGGRVSGPKWEERTAVVKQLIDRGYAEKIMLAHDSPLGMTLGPTERMLEMRTQFNPDSILFIHRKVLPRLRELGVAQRTLDTIMIDNPRRFFEAS